MLLLNDCCVVFSRAVRLSMDAVSTYSNVTNFPESEADLLISETSGIITDSAFESETTNQISLTFTHTESENKREKCKSFWKYIDSRPELKALMVAGWNENDEQRKMMEQKADEEKEPATSEHTKINVQQYVSQLKDKGLHQTLSCKRCCNVKRCCISSERVYADMVEESPEEVLEELRHFEKHVAKLKARRGNTPVQVYKPLPPSPKQDSLSSGTSNNL